MCWNHIHWTDAIVGGIIGLFLALTFDYIKNKFLLRYKYRYFTGTYLHGANNDLPVFIIHKSGDFFEVSGIDKNNGNEIHWKGAYHIIGDRILNGIFDYNYLNNPNIPDWGEHYIHLLPNNKTIHVIGEKKSPPTKTFSFKADKN